MVTLTKTHKIHDTYTVTIKSDYMDSYAQSYNTNDPLNSNITKLLVYAKNNNWDIREILINEKLSEKLYEFVTEKEILDDSYDVEMFDKRIKALSEDLNTVTPFGDEIESITITKFGQEYELDITSDDIHEIVLDLLKK